jgi:IclR family acetate operon transcriptional repressor
MQFHSAKYDGSSRSRGEQVSGKRTYNITALQRGLMLLHLFAKSEKGLSATEVAKSSVLPVSTVHRLLVNLQTAGFLDCDAGRIYHLGVACISIGQAARGQLDVRRLSLRHLQEVNQLTRETVHLTVREGLSAVYVEKLDSPEPLRIHSRVGTSVPLHCTAVGKVLLAHLTEPELDKILKEMEFRRFTENTIRSPQEMLAELRRVRKNGFACDLEEYEPHIRCVAAPIWDSQGAVNASLSVTGPGVRMASARIRQIAPLIRNAGLRISEELGYDRSRLTAAIVPTAKTVRG